MTCVSAATILSFLNLCRENREVLATGQKVQDEKGGGGLTWQIWLRNTGLRGAFTPPFITQIIGDSLGRFLPLQLLNQA